MKRTVEQIQRVIDRLEERLFQDVALAELARHAGCSPWHLHRTFTALVGETPAGYARRRRLGELCRQLAETDRPLVELALAGGFESQPAFTRAFTRQFGLSPGRYRRDGIVAPAHRYPRLDAAALAASNGRTQMEPRIEKKPAFHVVGLAMRLTHESRARIPELWSRFAQRMHEVPHRRGPHTLGVCTDAACSGDGETEFTYLAAVEVERLERVPAGMVALNVPANTYAIYTHRGHIAHFPKTVDEVFARWLPASPYEHAPGAELELYDERWDPETGNGEVDFLVPVTS